jgi:hypothetical protein
MVNIDFSMALKLAPKDLSIYYLRGLCYWHEGLLHQAQQDIKKSSAETSANANLIKAYLVFLQNKYKTQLASIIKSLQDQTLQFNAALQALCYDTTLGQIFYMQRKHKLPSITSGRLEELAIFLNKHAFVMQNLVLTHATRQALLNEVERTPEFAQDLQEHDPRLHKIIQRYLNRLKPPTLFAALMESNTSIQDESGNRFIQNAVYNLMK